MGNNCFHPALPQNAEATAQDQISDLRTMMKTSCDEEIEVTGIHLSYLFEQRSNFVPG